MDAAGVDFQQLLPSAYGRHDCGFCILELQPAKIEGGLDEMFVRSLKRPASDEEVQLLLNVLKAILENNKKFTALYDFRKYSIPSIDHIRTVAPFIQAALPRWDFLGAVAAVVITDGFFATLSKKLVTQTIGFLGLKPKCPFTICHDFDSAGKFIAENSQGNLARSPPTECSPQARLNGKGGLKNCGTLHSLASESSTISTEAGFSDVMPLSSESCISLPMTRELDNGDMQVIQSCHMDRQLNDLQQFRVRPVRRLCHWTRRIARPLWGPKRTVAGELKSDFSTSSFMSACSLHGSFASASDLLKCESWLSMYVGGLRSWAAKVKTFCKWFLPTQPICNFSCHRQINALADGLAPATQSFCATNSSCWGWASWTKSRNATARKRPLQR